MPIKSATGTSKFTVQPLSASSPAVSIGSLPTVEQVRSEVPEVVSQGEAFFSRDSIGSAKFDSRMDVPALPSNPTVLSRPRSSADKRISVSPQRPCAIASVDIFNSSGTDREKTAEAISQTLEVAEFNSSLLESDYEYVYSALKSGEATAPVMQDLEDTASSNLTKTNSVVSTVSALASARESFSQNLDVRVNWDNVSQKSSEFYATYSTRFGDNQGDVSLESLGINPRIDTGTAIVKRIQTLVTKASSEESISTSVGNVRVGMSQGYFAVDNRVKSIDLLFDDGEIGGYSNLGRLQKVAACSEFLSRVFMDTFTGMTGSAKIELPTFHSGSYIFEPQNLQRGNVVLPSHYEGIIDPSIRLLTSSLVDRFRSEVVKTYNDSYESAKMKTGVENVDEAGSPLDIYTRLLGKVKDSFPTLYTSIETSTFSNPTELYDSVNLLFSMKQRTSTKQFNGFMRGVLLTTLLDPDYIFLSDSGEEFDSVTDSKSEIQDSGDTAGSRTVKSKTGISKLATKTLTTESDVLVSSIFNYPERLKNFPVISRGYTQAVLTSIENIEGTVAATVFGQVAPLVSTFDPGTEASWVSTAPEYEGFSKNAPRAKNIPEAIKSTLPQGNTAYEGASSAIFTPVVDRIATFGRDDTGKTVANSIVDFYSELISLFESTYGKKLADVSPDGLFYTRNGTCTKRAIIDVILECMGNLVSYFLSPGYIAESSSTVKSSISTAAGGSSSRGTTTSASAISAAPVNTVWYLGLNESYYESLTFCESLSQITGDLNAAIASAYSSSGLSSTNDVAFLNDVLSTISSDLYPRHRGTRLAISSIAGISSIIDSASQSFSKSIADADASLKNLPQDLRSDVLNSLTTETVSQIALKEKLEYGIKSSLEESLSKYDVSAAKWFYTNYKRDLSSDKTCVVVGMPVGFFDELSRSTIQVTADKIKTGSLSMYRSMSKYKILASSRSVTRPYDNSVPLVLGKFHPFLHIYISTSVAENLLPLEIASTGAATLLCFDRASSTWVEVDYDDCVEFLSNGGNFGVSGFSQDSPTVSRDEVQDIIEFHVLDAVLKSTIRVSAGVNFDAASFCSEPRVIDSVAAPKMLSLFSLAPQNLVPRGNLQASEFLSANSDGTYSILPYSALSGRSSNLTDPSTHSLLLKFLGSGLFTSGELARRVITPPAFERVYCSVYDPSQFVTQDKNGKIVNETRENEISLFSLSVSAE